MSSWVIIIVLCQARINFFWQLTWGLGILNLSQSFIRWTKGQDAQFFTSMMTKESLHLWEIDSRLGKPIYADGLRCCSTNRSTTFKAMCNNSTDPRVYWTRHGMKKTYQILKNKRVIGWPSTAASMYAADLHSASPGIILYSYWRPLTITAKD